MFAVGFRSVCLSTSAQSGCIVGLDSYLWSLSDSTRVFVRRATACSSVRALHFCRTQLCCERDLATGGLSLCLFVCLSVCYMLILSPTSYGRIIIFSDYCPVTLVLLWSTFMPLFRGTLACECLEQDRGRENGEKGRFSTNKSLCHWNYRRHAYSYSGRLLGNGTTLRYSIFLQLAVQKRMKRPILSATER